MKYKIVLLGDAAVGKTAICHVYLGGTFTEYFHSTLGVNIFDEEKYPYEISNYSRKEKMGQELFQFQIFDIGGQDFYSKFIKTYIIGAVGALIVYDITSKVSFENTKKWLKHYYDYCDVDEVSVILIGNKIDLEESRRVLYEMGLEKSKDLGIDFIETSAKTYQNIEEAFKLIGSRLLEEKGHSISSLSARRQSSIKKNESSKLKLLVNEMSNISSNHEISGNSKKQAVLHRLIKLLHDSNFRFKNDLELTYGIRLSQLVEKFLLKNPFMLEAAYLLNIKISSYYENNGNIRSSDEYFFKALKNKYEHREGDEHLNLYNEVLERFWIRMGIEADPSTWHDLLKRNEKLYKLCLKEGDQLFRITLQAYFAYQWGHGPLLIQCEKRFEELKELFPESKKIFDIAHKSFKHMKSNLSLGKLFTCELKPRPLSQGSTANISIVIINNSNDSENFTLELIATGFEHNYHEQKRKIDNKITVRVNFLLGAVMAINAQQLSIQIRLYDQQKHLLDERMIYDIPLKESRDIQKQEPATGINVLFSYSTKDSEYFDIKRIEEILKNYPEIGEVYYWEKKSGQNIVDYMEQTLRRCHACILFCSINALNSKAVEQEWQAALQRNKKGLIKIIPVYEAEEHIPILLGPMLNVKFTKIKFEDFITKLYREILRESEI